VNALAIAIAKDKSSDELQFLALLFTQLGDTLALLAFEPSENGT
jgi:F0F1-type ATP synthase membrane subunit c/vacuolar-type H+-ATPase subunit K